MTGALALDPAKAVRMATLLRAVAHPVRLELLAVLREGEANVSQLIEVLGTPQTVVSGQLAILRMNGLVEVRRERGFAWYRLNLERLGEVLKCLSGDAIVANVSLDRPESASTAARVSSGNPSPASARSGGAHVRAREAS